MGALPTLRAATDPAVLGGQTTVPVHTLSPPPLTLP